MKLTLGYSPCPNDTFIFDALANKKIETGNLDLEVVLEDVEKLNQWAFEGRLDITKLSFPAFFTNRDQYILLNAGAALGKGVGPLLVTRNDFKVSRISDHSIAIPGVHTTANLLLSFSYPEALKKVPMVFSEIEDAVLSGKTDLGVIIHESRFTYANKGLRKIADLGALWEKSMNIPIPLGGIAMKRTIAENYGILLQDLIRKSIAYSMQHYPTISDYVKRHAIEMSEEVMRQHIELYVNHFTTDPGPEGIKAIETLYRIFPKKDGSSAKSHSSRPLFLS